MLLWQEKNQWSQREHPVCDVPFQVMKDGPRAEEVQMRGFLDGIAEFLSFSGFGRKTVWVQEFFTEWQQRRNSLMQKKFSVTGV